MDGCPMACMPSACVVMGDQTINNCEVQLLLQSSPRYSLAYATLSHLFRCGKFCILLTSLVSWLLP